MEFFNDIKIIWRFLAKYKREVYVIFIVAIFASIIEAAVPYIYGRIVDLIVANGELAGVLFFLSVWFILSLTKSWGHRYVISHGLMISMKCMQDFVLLLNRHSLNLNLAYHKKQKSGKMSSRYIKASDALEDILNNIVFFFAPDVLIVLFVLILMVALVHWLIVFVAIINILIYIFITLKYSKDIGDYIVKTIKSLEDAFGYIHDSISNIQTVKANSKEEYENKKISAVFENKTQEYFKKFILAIRKTNFFQDTSWAIGTLFLFIAAIGLFRNGIITIGQFVSVIGYLGLINAPMRNIGINIEHFRRWISIVKHGYSLLDESVEPYNREAIVLDKTKGQIEFKNIDFKYSGGNSILKDINFTVMPGHVIALVGESGVGKSTLVDLISRYNIPTGGEILLDGIDIQKIDLRNLRRQIAIVPQEVSLFNDTIKNNVIYSKLDATDEEIQSAIKAANADEFINNFPHKLDQEVGERGVKLSTGQKQRVAIARALLKNPKILILDEATSALDSKSELLVQKALKRLIKGRTTFVIAHRLSTIQHADKILVLDKGKIVESGRHSELIKKKGLYHKLFTLQSLGEAEEE